jgi:hypothetical protein
MFSRMSSRTFRRNAVVVLTLSLGALSLPSAEAASSRSASRHQAGAVIQGELLTQTFLQAVKDFLRFGKEYYQGGQNPGNNPPGKEGTGICPLGNPGNGNPGRG